MSWQCTARSGLPYNSRSARRARRRAGLPCSSTSISVCYVPTLQGLPAAIPPRRRRRHTIQTADGDGTTAAAAHPRLDWTVRPRQRILLVLGLDELAHTAGQLPTIVSPLHCVLLRRVSTRNGVRRLGTVQGYENTVDTIPNVLVLSDLLGEGRLHHTRHTRTAREALRPLQPYSDAETLGWAGMCARPSECACIRVRAKRGRRRSGFRLTTWRLNAKLDGRRCGKIALVCA